MAGFHEFPVAIAAGNSIPAIKTVPDQRVPESTATAITGNLIGIVRQVALIGIMATCTTFVIMTGGVDLSVLVLIILLQVGLMLLG